MSDLTKGDTQRSRIHSTNAVAPTLAAEQGRGQGVPTILPGESQTSADQSSSQLQFWQVDFLARTTVQQQQESAEAWLVTVAHSGGNSTGSLLSNAPLGLSERMYLASSVPTGDATSEPSSTVSFSLGMASPGLYWTASGSEYRNGADVCSLSGILEESPDPKYSLSARACTGILRRAEKRGKALPKRLATALRAVVSAGTSDTTKTGE